MLIYDKCLHLDKYIFKCSNYMPKKNIQTYNNSTRSIGKSWARAVEPKSSLDHFLFYKMLNQIINYYKIINLTMFHVYFLNSWSSKTVHCFFLWLYRLHFCNYIYKIFDLICIIYSFFIKFNEPEMNQVKSNWKLRIKSSGQML